jgi:hypothetical protein
MDKEGARKEVIQKLKEIASSRKFFSLQGHIEWYDEAVEEDPDGIFCTFCGGVNDFFDDAGWWYFPTPGCSKCWYSEVGKKWKEIHGTGDR